MPEAIVCSAVKKSGFRGVSPYPEELSEIKPAHREQVGTVLEGGFRSKSGRPLSFRCAAAHPDRNPTQIGGALIILSDKRFA